MKTAPLVSVLMTAYNREKFIVEAIESVLSSELLDFELIIVDDCSRDNTYQIAKRYEQLDKRIRVYKNDSNLSQFGNRNKAASYAIGKYIKYVDSDDIIYPYTLTHMVTAMEKYPKAGLGFCLTHGPCKMPLPYIIQPKEAFEQHFFTGGLLFVGPSGLIIRNDVFKDVKGFDEYGMPSDNHFALKVAAKYPVVALARDLFWWRLHDDQVFHHNKKNYHNILNNFAYSKDIIVNHSPLEKTQNNRILFNLKKNFLRHIFRLTFIECKPRLAITLTRKYLSN